MTLSDYSPDLDSKRCYKCKMWKSRDNFTKDRSTPDGLCRACKACASQISSEYRAKNAEKIKRRKAEEYIKNKASHSARMAEYYRKNSEKIKQRSKEHRQANEKQKAINGAIWYKKNRETVLERVKTYNREKPHVKAVSHQRRRARKKQLPNNFTENDWNYALAYFDNCCAVCGNPIGLNRVMAQDHWIPLSSPNCPGTVPENIIPLCHSLKGDSGGCNNSKQSGDARKWLIRKFGEKKASQVLGKVQDYINNIKRQKT